MISKKDCKVMSKKLDKNVINKILDDAFDYFKNQLDSDVNFSIESRLVETVGDSDFVWIEMKHGDRTEIFNSDTGGVSKLVGEKGRCNKLGDIIWDMFDGQ